MNIFFEKNIKLFVFVVAWTKLDETIFPHCVGEVARSAERGLQKTTLA